MIAAMSLKFEQKEPKIIAINSMSEDSILIREIRENGSEAAFAKLMKKYQERVYWMVRRTIFDHDDADEITQEVFIMVYQKIHQFREDSQFFTWLYKIASNMVLQSLRKKKLRNMVGLDQVSEIHSSDEPTAESEMIKSEWNEKLKAAIETLPPQQRLVFNMRYFDELSYEEISGILDKTTGGLKANYFHAVQKIKEQMEK